MKFIFTLEKKIHNHRHQRVSISERWNYFFAIILYLTYVEHVFESEVIWNLNTPQQAVSSLFCIVDLAIQSVIDYVESQNFFTKSLIWLSPIA
jgi:hypothetical protein